MAKTARKSLCVRVKNKLKCKKLKGCKLAKGSNPSTASLFLKS